MCDFDANDARMLTKPKYEIRAEERAEKERQFDAFHATLVDTYNKHWIEIIKSVAGQGLNTAYLEPIPDIPDEIYPDRWWNQLRFDPKARGAAMLCGFLRDKGFKVHYYSPSASASSNHASLSVTW